ncbi:dTDP-4-dehydrorhamnose reductase [Francisella uliginis]|uniref:dTDP-4-dehydrorhamnose reductase n=1 Tax=Francisella uliginis TaxID=573570 RepID=A0A1L4BU49_9GAMM|nr:dTDP-4-dehydrorhamnose reductase [Francisella uliginis]API87369.1 dTDP-4-dehydrorhamnose reductase [Francisella uliginis]
MNVLVTGSNGQLGSEIKELAQSLRIEEQKYKFYFISRDFLDVSDNEAVKEFILNNNIDAIINCAAYTAVDKAESDYEMANKVNHLAVVNMAKIAKEHNLRLIHISTDYIFNGESFKPYLENDKTNPQSVYGSTKLAGEMAIQSINPKKSIIIRTSWVYSYFGTNFVKTMLRLGKDKNSLGVIFDQVGSPTYAKDLAMTILKILPKLDNESVKIYNYSNEGVLSWYDFAKEIMTLAKLNCEINPIETIDFPTPAKRPHYSLLNKKKIKQHFGISIPYWKDSLSDCIKRLQKDL